MHPNTLTTSTPSHLQHPHALTTSTPSQPPHPHSHNLHPSQPHTFHPLTPSHTLTSTSPECRNRLWGIITAPTTPRPCETASDVQFAHIGITAPLKTSNWLSASMAVWMYCVCVWGGRGDRIIICKLRSIICTVGALLLYILQRS